MSIGPSLSSAPRISASTWLRREMLQAITAAFPPLSRIAAATGSQPSALRLEITTLAPIRAIVSAIERPMPRLEPVTTATLSVRSKGVLMRLLPLFPARGSVSVGAVGATAGRGCHSGRRQAWARTPPHLILRCERSEPRRTHERRCILRGSGLRAFAPQDEESGFGPGDAERRTRKREG